MFCQSRDQTRLFLNDPLSIENRFLPFLVGGRRVHIGRGRAIKKLDVSGRLTYSHPEGEEDSRGKEKILNAILRF
jgi:hypothetical protein